MWMRLAVFMMALLLNLSLCFAAPVTTTPQLIENVLGMKFVLIPSGEFMMGSNESAEVLARAFLQYEHKRFVELIDEALVHQVHITRPFYLGQHEVTVAQLKMLWLCGFLFDMRGHATLCHPTFFQPVLHARGRFIPAILHACFT